MIVGSSDGVEVAVHELARPTDPAPTLLVCHANGFHGRCYAPVVEALRTPVHAFAPDVRGHGLTPAPPGWQVDWAGYTDDVLAVAEALPGPVFGFGHSMGGACLLLAARRRPELFRGFLLYEPIIFPPAAGSDPTGGRGFAAITRRRRAQFDSIEDALANFAVKPPMSSFTPEALHAYVTGGFGPDPSGRGVRLRCDPETEAATFETGLANGGWDALPHVPTPTRVLGGKADSGPPATVAQPVARRLPHGRYLELPELDHFGPMTAPSVVASFVDELLAAP